MGAVTIGMDIAKGSVQLYGEGLKKKLYRSEVLTYFGKQEAPHGGAGGLQRVALLGRVSSRKLGHDGASHAAAVREAVRETEQERRGGRGSVLGGGAAAVDAFRAGKDRGAAGGIAAPPRARTPDMRAHESGEPGMRVSCLSSAWSLSRGVSQIRNEGERGAAASMQSAFRRSAPNLLDRCVGDFNRLDERLEECEELIKAQLRDDPVAQKLDTIAGVGPIIATADASLDAGYRAFQERASFCDEPWAGALASSSGKTIRLGEDEQARQPIPAQAAHSGSARGAQHSRSQR